MKTSELSEMALDFAVAVAEGWQDYETEDYGFSWHTERGSAWLSLFAFQPSQLWDQGGPIIERERIRVAPNLSGTWNGQIRHTTAHPLVTNAVLSGWTNQHGPTPLIAAMRCHVASKLGEEVDIPSGIA